MGNTNNYISKQLNLFSKKKQQEIPVIPDAKVVEDFSSELYNNLKKSIEDKFPPFNSHLKSAQELVFLYLGKELREGAVRIIEERGIGDKYLTLIFVQNRLEDFVSNEQVRFVCNVVEDSGVIKSDFGRAYLVGDNSMAITELYERAVRTSDIEHANRYRIMDLKTFATSAFPSIIPDELKKQIETLAQYQKLLRP